MSVHEVKGPKVYHSGGPASSHAASMSKTVAEFRLRVNDSQSILSEVINNNNKHYHLW